MNLIDRDDIMALNLGIPTIDAQSAETLRETILTSEPDAKIDIDLDEKTVIIEAQASEETFKQLVEAAGHPIR
jgi:copper chaperone